MEITLGIVVLLYLLEARVFDQFDIKWLIILFLHGRVDITFQLLFQ